jgi:hypothetical protein
LRKENSKKFGKHIPKFFYKEKNSKNVFQNIYSRTKKRSRDIKETWVGKRNFPSILVEVSFQTSYILKNLLF